MREESIKLRWRAAKLKDVGVVIVDGKPMVLQESHGVPYGEGYGVYMGQSDYHDIKPEAPKTPT